MQYSQVLKNKEKLVQEHHQILYNQRYKKAEHEFKRKQVGKTEQQYKWNEYITKFHEHHDVAKDKKRALDQTFNEKNGKFNKELNQKLKLANIKKMDFLHQMSLSKMRNRNDDGDDNFSTEGKSKRMALSQSAYQLRRDGNSLNRSADDQDEVLREMAQIESKLNRAYENRARAEDQRIQSIKSKPELSTLLQQKQDREQKYMEDIFAQVTMKRHDKEKALQKREKNNKYLLEAKAEKERERQEQKQHAMAEIIEAGKKRDRNLKNKFDRMDLGKREVDQSISEYKRTLREFNTFKQIDTEEHLQRLRKGRSVYRERLAEKIMEKSQRA